MAPKNENATERAVQVHLAQDLKARVGQILDSVGQLETSRLGEDFERLADRLADIFRRRRVTHAANNDVRDLLCETLFSGLKGAFQQFLRSNDATDPRRAAEAVLGSLIAADVCADFAAAVERSAGDANAMAEAFSLGGLTDFISVEEILQLLGSGKHTGRLRFEHSSAKLDVYFRNGHVAFLNPSRLHRRVLPTRDASGCREIPQKVIDAAEAAYEADGKPLVETLQEHKFFRESEVRDAGRLLGSEVLYGLMTDEEPMMFTYVRLTDVPEFVVKYDMRLGVTPILLEGSRRFDESNNMRQVFPDHDEPVRMKPDALVRLANVTLTPLELKTLANLNEGVSPRELSAAIGLPLFETLSMLVRFAQQGVVACPGGEAALRDVVCGIQNTLQSALQALDANEDQVAVTNALDKAFGIGGDFTSPRGPGRS